MVHATAEVQAKGKSSAVPVRAEMHFVNGINLKNQKCPDYLLIQLMEVHMYLLLSKLYWNMYCISYFDHIRINIDKLFYIQTAC